MAKKRQVAVTARIVWILVALFLLITVISQLIIHYYNPLITEPAELYSFEGYIQSMGVYVRNEKTVSYSGNGIISYVYDDGEKLAKNSVIAKIYSSESDLALQNKVDELKNQISVLKDAEKLIGSDNSQLEAFSNQIYEHHSQMLENVIDGDYMSVSKMKNEYLNLICKKQIVSGFADNYSAKIAELENRVASLSSQISSAPRDYSLQDIGYFVSTVDGYENVLNLDSVNELTKEKIEEIINNPTLSHNQSEIGKIISDYKWKLVCIVPAEQSKQIYKDAQLKVRVGNNLFSLTGNVDSIENADSENKILVLSFNVFNQDLIKSRTTQIRILFDEYNGIRIPSAAVHFNEKGEKGVFIKVGVNIYFRYIDIVRTEGDYTLVKDTTDKKDYLSLYDSVIVEGTDLYDGKIVLQ